MDSSKRGFTLIEVMVALTLLGLVATLLVSGSRLGLDISARGNRRTEAIRTEHTERALLRSQLQGALPLHYWTEAENRRVEQVAFDGDVDRIRFVSRVGALDGLGGLPRWVVLRGEVTQNREDKLVVEENRILSPDNQPDRTPIARVELMNCKDVRFAYLDTSGEKSQWLASWNGPDRKAPLPSAIRIQCKTADNGMQMLIPLDYSEPARQGVWMQ